MSRSSIGVIVPAYNEIAALPETLESLITQTDPADNIIVVNNASIDQTRQIADEFESEHPSLTVIDEKIKGTGNAVRPGARYLIDQFGTDIIARTDADTVVSPGWIGVMRDYFEEHPNKLFLGGITLAKDDEYCRPIDRFLVFNNYFFGRPVYSLAHRSLWPLRLAYGHNMSVRTDAYEAVGGFRPGSIDNSNEDDLFSEAIYRSFGFSSMGFDSRLRVRTSPRRLRIIGYAGALGYYLDNTREGRSRRTGGEIDIR